MAKKAKTVTTTATVTNTTTVATNPEPEKIDLKKISFNELYHMEQASKNICSMYEQMAKIDEYDNRTRYNNKITENIEKFNQYVACRKNIIKEIERRLQCIS